MDPLPRLEIEAEQIEKLTAERGIPEFSPGDTLRVWRGRAVPEVLTSGHHEKIRLWRRAEAERITRERRPDLWARYLERDRPSGRKSGRDGGNER